MKKYTAKWRRGDYKRRVYDFKGERRVAEGYEIDFLIDGQVQASWIGVPDYRYGVFKLRGGIIYRHAIYVPKTRELAFGKENKDFEIEV